MSTRRSPIDSTSPMSRRDAIATAAAIGASIAWPGNSARGSRVRWQERRDRYPQGVASGDPTPDGMILWTRRPPVDGTSATRLSVEIASDVDFRHIVSATHMSIDASSDWTCRVLVGGLAPAHEYWYRFTDDHGFGSRIGRTITAPSASDAQPVHFAFVSCQNAQLGAFNAYRRMIWEDERRPRDDQLGFVLHLGDFVYEVVWYPEDRPQGYYARRVRDIVRYANAEKHADFHIPTTVDDYRALYRAYLLDIDLQDARARWPFVCMPDNHEFSWKGWQSQESFDGRVIPAQTRKVAANQAWFEYQPARVSRPGAANAFQPPRVVDAPLDTFDAHGFGLEPGNRAAVGSLTTYRALRWGRNVELILTDNRSFRSEPLSQKPEYAPFQTRQFPAVVSEEITDILDAGRTMSGGNPAATISFAGAQIPNSRKDAPPQSMLGAIQKAWFLDRLAASKAQWKIWGNSVATLDWRIDFQNLPEDVGIHWPTTGYAILGDEDWSGYRHERREIFDFIHDRGIGGVALVCGDRHSFLAGVSSPSLPPESFRPIAVEFVTGSISAPGIFEAMEYALPKDHPLRPIYVHDAPSGAVQPAVNLSILHGVRASLALQHTGDIAAARAASNKQIAPHLSFADLGGHGYAVVTAISGELSVEFVCIPRPLSHSGADGGPLAYRVTHRARHWARGEAPALERISSEGELPLGV